MLNHQLSQKLTLIRRGKFIHLINILILPLTSGLRLPFNRPGEAQHVEYLIQIGGK
jgi:hypothetical protein